MERGTRKNRPGLFAHCLLGIIRSPSSMAKLLLLLEKIPSRYLPGMELKNYFERKLLSSIPIPRRVNSYRRRGVSNDFNANSIDTPPDVD
ncbi:hypothetical protein TSAR_016355 [Trichomalopsis sarcophagae]|uniref:Uncharacterized protein n=1 Tax=Trichomalopsis sarcophagae TaxID=543379 RepID=A0A232F632_9HYME|nr:hypothetical protein TSAR_016355 [Trichomalopsis sarcophagae]